MALNLEAKKAIVAEVTEVASRSLSAVAAHYRGLTVNQMTQLRSEARKAGVYVRVVKNSLTRRAFENTSFACLNDRMVGPLFIAMSMEAPSDAARLLKDFVKQCDQLEVKALCVSGQIYEANQIDAVASLPTREEALGKLMFVMKAPVEKFVRTLAEPHAKLVRLLAAVKDAKTE